MAISGTTAFPFRIAPLNNLPAFTYATGTSHMRLLELLRVYVNDTLRVEFNDNFDLLLTELEAGIQNAEAVVLEAKDGWETVFNAYMLDVNASLMALNDTAMATLINDPATETGAALVNGFAQRSGGGVLYVNPVTGSDTNDGVTAVEPLATINEAFARVTPYAQDADTDWTINLAAGVYTERVRPAMFTPHAMHVTIQGPAVGHPSTPLVTFTEGTGAVAVAMFFSNPNGVITVKDVKFVGYNGSASSCGINSTDGQIFTVNVHTENCYFGVSSAHGILNVKGGIFDNCGRLAAGGGNGAGIRSLFLNHHGIGLQSAGNHNSGPIFRNNVNGVFAQESSTGHSDWVTYEDNVNAIALNINSRVNAEGSKFVRNNTDFNARGNSNFNIPASVVFGVGADKSGQVSVIASGSQAPSAKALDTDTSYSRAIAAVNGIYTATTVTGTTASVAAFTRTLYAPWWGDTTQVSGTPPKRLRIRAVGNIAGTAGTKLVSVKMGTLATSVSFANTETGAFTFDAEVIFASPTRQIINGVANRHFGDTQRMGVGVGGQDMTTDKELTLNVGLDNAGDSVTFEYIELSLA